VVALEKGVRASNWFILEKILWGAFGPRERPSAAATVARDVHALRKKSVVTLEK